MASTRENRLKSRAERRRQMQNQHRLGHTFDMPATNLLLDERVEARVRRISLSDEAASNLIPDHLQDQVNQGLKVLEKAQEEIRQNGVSDDTLRDRVRNNRIVLPAADAYCVATFVSPRLAFDEAEAERLERDLAYWEANDVAEDDREVWTVDMVDAEDRIDWFMANLDADRAKAMNLKRFRPRSVVDVAHRPAEPMAPTAISLVEAP